MNQRTLDALKEIQGLASNLVEDYDEPKPPAPPNVNDDGHPSTRQLVVDVEARLREVENALIHLTRGVEMLGQLTRRIELHMAMLTQPSTKSPARFKAAMAIANASNPSPLPLTGRSPKPPQKPPRR